MKLKHEFLSPVCLLWSRLSHLCFTRHGGLSRRYMCSERQQSSSGHEPKEHTPTSKRARLHYSTDPLLYTPLGQ
ncbi:unnamed protein product [Pleuronectes platessa]|uniref:Uncharacterized protein n=1 Tax=Pleuronectes platessa TaxID=8262 RepID=A0A9N7UZ63_PLEPL|nr:unnamed protein product [Pleuronectes platessa]